MAGLKGTSVQTVEVLRRAGPSGREGYWAHGIWLVASQIDVGLGWLYSRLTAATCQTKFKDETYVVPLFGMQYLSLTQAPEANSG